MSDKEINDDYDMQGFFLSGNHQAANGHFTDEFKKPNHMTFSTDSKYSNKSNGIGGKWIQQNGKWYFYASKTNLKYHSPIELKEYFKRVEPDSVLILPKQ